ncbi:FAD-NAD(P)-binding-domain-containing protein [Hypoxylon sp. FL1150]|nr:FAD-NAD(P)-binding-domain-containing protein [Hypoxylon sp. FL1150]
MEAESPTPTTPQTDQRTQTSHVILDNGRCHNCLQRREIASVVIVGAGAAGIAVALSVLEKVKAGWPMDSIIIMDKGKSNEDRGRGTAYSSAMNGTVCSRRDDQMSLVHNEPNHFKDWAQRQPMLRRMGNGHSERKVYGDYLQDMLRKVNTMAFDQRVDFRFIGQEAVDIDRYTDGADTLYAVKLSDGCFVYARNVVLALGNFLKTTPTLVGAPGYFSNPWPLGKLEVIPQGAAVGIMGAGPAAFEVLTKLYELRHEGRIYMMDKTGLPRLERPLRTYAHTHAIHAAIRGLEKRGPSLESFLSELDNMLRQYDVGISVPQTGVPLTSYADHANTRLLDAMGKFDGDEGRSLVVDALRPVAHRIWESVAPLERDYLRNHPVWKGICQETIPRNIVALYTIRATGTGNLEIIDDEGLGSKQGYFLMGMNTRARVDYVIDTSSLEYDLKELELSSPLLRKMRRKGLVTSEETGGGVKVGVVDHRILAADDESTPTRRRGLYAIGSLTKGTHYFVEDISRITSHALRISDSIVDLPRSSPKQVALFVGRDLFSTVIMMNVVPALLAQGHMPYVFLLPPSTESVDVNNKERLYWYFELSVLEKVLLADFRARLEGPPQLALATDAVENAYGVLVQSVEQVNTKAFLAATRAYNIDIGFVIGSEMVLEAPLRNAFPLFRLKPGLPPYYQSTREVIQAGGERFGHTLDRLGTRSEVICEDSLFVSKDRSIKGAPCACTAMFDSYGLAVELVTGTVDRYSRTGIGESIRREFSPLPDVNEPVTLVTLTAMLDRVLRQFVTPESEDRIIRNIEDDIKAFGVTFDAREFEAWKIARNPSHGFM